VHWQGERSGLRLKSITGSHAALWLESCDAKNNNC